MQGARALLAFAACGVTGHALADLSYGPGQGGTILAGLLGRTVASGDALHTVSVFVTNQDAICFLKRPRDFSRDEMTLTIHQLDSLVTEFVTIEQGMVLQNLALMAQAMGLGGFPHWAAHPYGWLAALGFRMQTIPATRYFGMNPALRFVARILKRDVAVSHAVGLEHDGAPLLVPFCPPYYPSMADAVRAVVDYKFGAQGVFRAGVRESAWREPAAISDAAKPPGAAAIEATIAHCEYVHGRYGRFPAYQPPFRTVLGFQTGHVDTAFYDRHYKPEALSGTQRDHMAHWHA